MAQQSVTSSAAEGGASFSFSSVGLGANGKTFHAMFQLLGPGLGLVHVMSSDATAWPSLWKVWSKLRTRPVYKHCGSAYELQPSLRKPVFPLGRAPSNDICETWSRKM